jgi:hypothetical protein
MSNGYCSISNPQPTPYGGPGGTATKDQAIQFILGKGGLQDNVGAAYINQNRACLINQLQYYSAFNDMQKVPYNSTAFYNYRNAIRDALLANVVCTGDGGAKPPGSTGCHLGSTVRCPSTDPICMQDCSSFKVGFDLPSIFGGKPGYSDEADCRNKQAAAGCFDAPAAKPPSTSDQSCLQLAGINCTQLGLIGAVAVFGIFVLVVIKR